MLISNHKTIIDIRSHRRARSRRGNVAALSVFLIAIMVTVFSMTLDLKYIQNGEEELSRSTDAAALAGCWELFDAKVAGLDSGLWGTETQNEAQRFVTPNDVAGDNLTLASTDIELGIYDLSSGTFQADQTNAANAVRVSLYREEGSNGEVPLFFSGVLGRESQRMEATSIAAMASNITGFYALSNESSTINMLPFALDLETWQAVMAGETDDQFGFAGSVYQGSNGLHECNLYPQSTGSPGNRGTVDIGGSNNSTNDIARQIVDGISADDLDQLGVPLAMNDSGYLMLNGDTGISAGVKDELASIIGEKRIIPIFESVTGNGNNANYRIVKFVGIRVLEVKLTGRMSQKRVIVEPCPVLARGAKVSLSETSSSDFVYSPAMLVL